MRWAWSILLLLVAVPSGDVPERRTRLGRVAQFVATPVSLYPGRDPATAGVGRLRFVAGYRLSSADPAFGGFSSLLVEGERMTLLSDGGALVRFRLSPSGRISDARFDDLPAGPGTGWTKADRDSESMTRDPGTGRIWVGFEQAQAIWRFAPGFARAEHHVAPPAMRNWPANGGAEAVVRLGDGTFVVFGERPRGRGGRGRAALRFAGDPTLPGTPPPTAFTYLPPPGYVPSDAAALPDGRLVVLNRRFGWRDGFTATLAIVDPAAIHAGAEVGGKEIARFAGAMLRDNFEGVAVTTGADGATELWLVSDDNHAFFLQSLLLKFRLAPE